MRVHLPYATSPRHLCLVCGNYSDTPYLACIETDLLTLEKPDVAVGDEVEYYVPDFVNTSGGKTTHLKKEIGIVFGLFYANGQTELGVIDWTRRITPDPHTLCISLATGYDMSDRTWKSKPYEPGDAAMSCISMTYADFLKWKEGNIEGLQKPV